MLSIRVCGAFSAILGIGCFLVAIADEGISAVLVPIILQYSPIWELIQALINGVFLVVLLVRFPKLAGIAPLFRACLILVYYVEQSKLLHIVVVQGDIDSYLHAELLSMVSYLLIACVCFAGKHDGGWFSNVLTVLVVLASLRMIYWNCSDIIAMISDAEVQVTSLDNLAIARIQGYLAEIAMLLALILKVTLTGSSNNISVTYN